MLTLILLLVVTQVPCAQGESSAVCHCKQGSASACAALEVGDPAKFMAIKKAMEVLKIEEENRQRQASVSSVSEADSSSSAPEPPDCKGQQHHIISRPIAKALDAHPTLSGHFKARDPRFVTQAVDGPSHCGYQDWHRKIDEEVINWLDTHKSATPKEFLEFLRRIYSRPAMRARFPNGF
jgi:hypothetical protein